MPDRWMSAIIEDVKGRMKDALPDIVAGISGSLAPVVPPEPPKPSLEAFMQASPEDRQAFWAGIPPEDYAKVTTDMMTEATNRWGAMAKNLQPLFNDGQQQAMLQHLNIGQATGIDANLGVAAAHHDLVEMLGMDPFTP